MLAHIANLMRSGKKTNAFAPIVWFCGIILLLCFSGMFYFEDHIIRYTLLALIVIAILFACSMYLVLLLKDPRLLQSETFRIEDKKLDIIASKGREVQLNPIDLITPTKEIGGKEDE